MSFGGLIQLLESFLLYLLIKSLDGHLSGRIGCVPSTTKSDDSHGVPGWGIALLVLVSILLFLALLALLYLIVHWCRRRHRGHLDLISTRDSYHPMNEYPTYETHGRYAAPGSKQNPYNEVSEQEPRPVGTPPDPGRLVSSTN
uniref:Mucin 1, cell surface associated n=1 Tax=Anolis carolinensis TaxID=28377 RepID=A0A803TCL2_ANOCA